MISAWANSKEPGSALRAEVLLKLMWALYKRGHESAKPNVQTFTCVINAWARSREKNGVERAEALLDQMIKLYEKDPKNSNVKPNVHTFTSGKGRWRYKLICLLSHRTKLLLCSF